ELSRAFVASGFDMSLLYRAICRSDAYGRTSRLSHLSQRQPELFARMPLRPLSGEQLFDSLAQAIGYESLAERSPGEPDRDPVRRAVVTLFAGAPSGDPQTSVAQALALMNGEVTATATAATSSRLKRIVEQFPNEPHRQV